MKQEFIIMSALPYHDNLVQFYGVSIERERFSLVMEYCPKGNLVQILKDLNIKFDWEVFYRFSSGILQGLSVLHNLTPPIVHRDLKPENLLIGEKMDIKLADFGLSKYAGLNSSLSSHNELHGTSYYLAPEIVSGNPHSIKSDIYAFAIILWQMIFRVLTNTFSAPYNQQNIPAIVLLFKTSNEGLRPEIPDNTPKELSNLLIETWDGLPENRPTITDIKKKLMKQKLNNIQSDQHIKSFSDTRIKREKAYNFSNIIPKIQQNGEPIVLEKKRTFRLSSPTMLGSLNDDQPKKYTQGTIKSKKFRSESSNADTDILEFKFK